MSMIEDSPCLLNSLEWPLGQNCEECGHHAIVHPGAGGDLDYCFLCVMEDLLYGLGHKEALIEALLEEFRREAMP